MSFPIGTRFSSGWNLRVRLGMTSDIPEYSKSMKTASGVSADMDALTKGMQNGVMKIDACYGKKRAKVLLPWKQKRI